MATSKGPKPSRWKAGPDPRRHDQYKAWAQQLNQARWRGEEWNLPFEDWIEFWDAKWDKGRGRGRDCYCLVRQRYDEPWSKHNVELITRRQHTATQADKLAKVRGQHWRLERNRSRLFASLEDVRD